jgi:lipopolysaccharide biosynthesis glycosyltransferase
LAPETGLAWWKRARFVFSMIQLTEPGLFSMEPVVLALASNERYFPGLYCAIASALSHMARGRTVDLQVLDGGISQTSKNILSRLTGRFGSIRLQFKPIDTSIFRSTTLGPGRSHMAYSRILLPRVLDVPRLIYLDCDVLVFRDLSELFDRKLSPGKILAAVRDSETLSLGDDSRTVADAMKLPAEGAYFNSGVMLMNLDEFRKQNFLERSLKFLESWNGNYRFWDQSALNFLLHGLIDALPGYWNRASWQFDEQNDNDLGCVLHYTRSAPWLGETPGPGHVLFERFAVDAGLPIIRERAAFKKSRRQQFFRNALAPLRALGFPLVAFLYKIAGQNENCAAYQKSARYWVYYILNAPRRRRLHHRRIKQIKGMKFKCGMSKLAA